LAPERIVISPGPCTPREAGLSNDIIAQFGPTIPLLGVCLGHQCIGPTFGGEVIVNHRMMHGKTSLIRHTNDALFECLPNPLTATRYHSLFVRRDTLPDALEITAWCEEDPSEIMGLRHRQFP